MQHKKFEYYSSPVLSQNNFKHAFFTKSSSEKFLQLLGNHFNENYTNCVSNQIHSNVIVFGSHSEEGIKTDADGLVNNKCNQNLWVYTADCMPIFFADKRTRNVATLHCGRKGLEKKIIKNMVKIFDNFGTYRDDLLVAIGPAISKEHYLVDKVTLKEFYRKAENKNITVNWTKTESDLCFSDLNHFKEQNLNHIDLKKSAYRQLLNENILNTNIDISNLCTYKLKNEFNSWRRSKTISRQWNCICSQR
nr:peptidoglycan editing factor PgeF [Prochlorococcus marinus]